MMPKPDLEVALPSRAGRARRALCAGGLPALAAVCLTAPTLAPTALAQAAERTPVPPAPAQHAGITRVPGIRAGHFTYADAATGCTVVIADGGAVGAVDVRGGAPGTVETDLLDPANTVQRVNAVFLSGGSAFGLSARDGVVRHLEERGEGYRVADDLVVPIVPGAILFDLAVARGVRPGADCGYAAAAAASSAPLAEGSVGAGAGATVGKLRGMASAMRGGVGTAAIELEGGLVVAALVAVNAVGDVIDPASGRIVAGVRSPDGGFADARLIIRGEAPAPTTPGRDAAPAAPGRDAAPNTPGRDAPASAPGRAAAASPGRNTTIGVVATNALLTKAQATKVAQMAHDGLARAIVPSHTPGDGDTVFALATGTLADGFSLGQVGALAAEAVADAIVRAVRAATGLPSLPAVRDLPPGSGPVISPRARESVRPVAGASESARPVAGPSESAQSVAGP